MESIDDIVRQIVEEANHSLRLRQVILFGSRARGDARPDSDIDLAFEHDSEDTEWAAFVNEILETAPTLLSLDLVELNNADASFGDRIRAEGRIVHG